jgi:predicted dehydrogenase
MDRRYRVGVIGFAHMHVNELVDRFIACGRADIVACADSLPLTPSLTTVEGSRAANLQRALASPGAPRAYADWRDLLREQAPDIAIICAEISQHASITEAAAAAGAHVVTEKPMAATLADARRMATAMRAAGHAIAVNWPITWRPAIRRVKELLAEGAIGTVTQLKWRNSPSLGPLAHGSLHPGATTIGLVSPAEKAAEWWHQAAAGGGALLDYCCYGACLAAWLLDAPPVAATCMAANLMHGFGDAEDNATLLLRFPAATAILEASWTTFHNGAPGGPIVIGTHGTIVVDGADVLLFTERGARTPTRVEQGAPLPPGRATIAEAFLHHLETGEPLHPTLDLPVNLAATAMLDAGRRAVASGTEQAVEPA